MSIIGAFHQYLSENRQRRQRVRTQEIVNALPYEIQKDIGWPGFYPDHGVGRGKDYSGLHRS
jgi:hypothetical protein